MMFSRKVTRMSPHPSVSQHEEPGDAQRLLGIVRGLARDLRPDTPGVDSMNLDHALERDFGLDSLARVELLLRIERELGTRLDEKALVAAETPRDLLRLIAEAAGIEMPVLTVTVAEERPTARLRPQLR